VEVKIGVQNSAREIALESAQSADEIQQAVADALESVSAGKTSLLVLTDERGRTVMVPADRLAYVEIGEPTARRVGFGPL
jgi:hypothetical protein